MGRPDHCLRRSPGSCLHRIFIASDLVPVEISSRLSILFDSGSMRSKYRGVSARRCAMVSAADLRSGLSRWRLLACRLCRVLLASRPKFSRLRLVLARIRCEVARRLAPAIFSSGVSGFAGLPVFRVVGHARTVCKTAETRRLLRRERKSLNIKNVLSPSVLAKAIGMGLTRDCRSPVALTRSGLQLIWLTILCEPKSLPISSTLPPRPSRSRPSPRRRRAPRPPSATPTARRSAPRPGV